MLKKMESSFHFLINHCILELEWISTPKFMENMKLKIHPLHQGVYYQSAAGKTKLTVSQPVDTMATGTIATATISRISPRQVTVYPGSAMTLQVRF